MDFLSEILKETTLFYRSYFFSVIKFLLGIYAVVLFADLVLLLVQRGIRKNIKEAFLGANVPAELVRKKNKLASRWSKLKSKLDSPNEGEWKSAVLDADLIIDDLIKRMGYGGKNHTLGERLAEINPGQIANIEKIREAHEVRNKIISEASFHLTAESAKEAIEKYEEFLKEFEVLE